MTLSWNHRGALRIRALVLPKDPRRPCSHSFYGGASYIENNQESPGPAKGKPLSRGSIQKGQHDPHGVIRYTANLVVVMFLLKQLVCLPLIESITTWQPLRKTQKTLRQLRRLGWKRVDQTSSCAKSNRQSHILSVWIGPEAKLEKLPRVEGVDI